MKRFALMMFALAACSKAEPTATPDNKDPGVAPRTPEVAVELAGVTLADDCPDGSNTKPIPPPPAPKAAKTDAASDRSMEPPAAKMAAESMAAGACADPSNCHGPPPRACEQTSMQLSVKAPAGSPATKLAIKRVELLDEAGKLVGELTARLPTKWNGKDTYVTWDEAIAASNDLVASYKLTAPDWNKLTNGRYNAPSKRFKLRVTMTVGNKDRTIEKQSITPAMPEPEVAT